MLAGVVIVLSLMTLLAVAIYSVNKGYNAGRYAAKELLVSCVTCENKTILTLKKLQNGATVELLPLREGWVFFLHPRSFSFRCPGCADKEDSSGTG